MIAFLRKLHNRRPLLWTVTAFVVVVLTAATLTVWWNVLLVQNHRILQQMTAAAAAAARDPETASFPLALLMVLGILCSFVILAGLLYLFLRLIKSVQLNLAQSQFIAAVTHELRSPVASLQILLDTIRDPTTGPDSRREFEASMHAELRRLRNLVDQVLETTRLENYQPATRLEDFPPQQAITSAVKGLESRIRASNARVVVMPPPPGIRVRGNPRLVETALGNILDNALKYSAGRPDIEVSVVPGSRDVVIEVTDKGIGISRKEQKKIFRRFYRTGDPLTQEKTGTGLGLYFARLAARAQGGDVTLDSPGPGQGSTFRLRLKLSTGETP